MKSNLLFDFTVDKATHTVKVERAFAADQTSVWNAFTKQEILDQWWAPKPWLSQTKYMNFKEGGRRFYAMVGPEGEKHWSIQDFTSIHPQTDFAFNDAFADENEHVSTEMPGSTWHLSFVEKDGVTTVKISIKHKSLADLEAIITMGFKEGFTMTLDYLATLLSK